MRAPACAVALASAALAMGPGHAAPMETTDAPRELNAGEMNSRADRYGNIPEPYLFPPEPAPHTGRNTDPANPVPLLAASEALNDVYSTGSEAVSLAGIKAPASRALGAMWDYTLALQNASEVSSQKGELEGRHTLAKECAATFVGNSLAPAVGGVVVAGGSWAITGACVGFLAKKFGQAVVRVGYDFARDLWEGKLPESTLGDYVEGKDLQDPLQRWQRKNAYFQWARGLAPGDMPTERDFRMYNREHDGGLAPGNTVEPIAERPRDVGPPRSRPDAPLPKTVSKALDALRNEVPGTMSFDGKAGGAPADYRALLEEIGELDEPPDARDRDEANAQVAGEAILRPLQNEVRGTIAMEDLASEAIDAENAHRRAIHQTQVREAQRREQELRIQRAVGNALGQALAKAIEHELASAERSEERPRRKSDTRGNHRTESQGRGDQKPRADSAARQCTPGCR